MLPQADRNLGNGLFNGLSTRIDHKAFKRSDVLEHSVQAGDRLDFRQLPPLAYAQAASVMTFRTTSFCGAASGR